MHRPSLLALVLAAPLALFLPALVPAPAPASAPPPCCVAAPTASPAPEDADEAAGGAERGALDARAAFGRLRAAAGFWRGASTMGWKDEVRIDVIARGSVVMLTSRFEAHPGETMVTMFHLHEGKLLLTHYCVAGNQPRLVATDFGEGGRVRFEFLDATGIASRDEWHMDQVDYELGEARIVSRWSSYQNGSLQPMETITLERVE